MKHSWLTEIDYWDRTIRRAARAAPKVEKGGSTPRPRFGIVVRGYANNLKAALSRVKAIESLVGQTTRQIDYISRLLGTLDSEIRAAQTSGGGFRLQTCIAALTRPVHQSVASWTPVCDQAVDALFAAHKSARSFEISYLKTVRAYHNCIRIYAHNPNPDPPPSCHLRFVHPRLDRCNLILREVGKIKPIYLA